MWIIRNVLLGKIFRHRSGNGNENNFPIHIEGMTGRDAVEEILYIGFLMMDITRADDCNRAEENFDERRKVGI